MLPPWPDTEEGTYMNKDRISKAFEGKKVFIPFIAAGDPDLKSTETFIYELERAGAGLIEIGIPFSDPIADGPVIQNANIRALKGGVTINKIFDMVKNVRAKTQIPLVFLTYLNPVFNYGYEKFFNKCAETGIDGLIIPDMPYEEQAEILEYSEKTGVDIISFLAPTSGGRIEKIAKAARGFIYVASSMGTTGVRNEITTDLETIIKSAKKFSKTPCAVGFGINTPKQVKEIEKFADGAIVGSAIVKIIEEHGKQAGSHIYEYVKTMCGKA